MLRTLTLVFTLMTIAAHAGASENLNEAFKSATSAYGQDAAIEKVCLIGSRDSHYFLQRAIQRLMQDPNIDIISAQQAFEIEERRWTAVYRSCDKHLENMHERSVKDHDRLLKNLSDAVIASR